MQPESRSPASPRARATNAERVAVSTLRIGQRILGLAQLLEIRRDRKIRRGAGEVFVLDRLRRRDRLGSLLHEYRLAA
jgi:hypothetical protein